jgi:hypothetical protein
LFFRGGKKRTHTQKKKNLGGEKKNSKTYLNPKTKP